MIRGFLAHLISTCKPCFLCVLPGSSDFLTGFARVRMALASAFFGVSRHMSSVGEPRSKMPQGLIKCPQPLFHSAEGGFYSSEASSVDDVLRIPTLKRGIIWLDIHATSLMASGGAYAGAA
jgi:hypothetical protein